MVLEFLAHQSWAPGFVALKEGEHLFSPLQSLAVIVSCLGFSIIASIIAKRREDRLALAEASKVENQSPEPAEPANR